jgi:hypothetical protein
MDTSLTEKEGLKMESEKTFQELSSQVIPSAADYQLIRIDEVSAITTLGKSSINL